jgi:hypothetical protein
MADAVGLPNWALGCIVMLAAVDVALIFYIMRTKR